MKPSSDNDTHLLRKMQDDYARGQVDAKGHLYLMSRRPFSNMWKDIRGSSSLTFPEVHDLHMIEGNKKFSQGEASVPKLFYKTSYGEQFFPKDSKIPFDFIGLKDLVLHSFWTNNWDDAIPLLKKGIIPTTVIRNLNPKEVKVVNEQNQPQSTETPHDSVERPTDRYKFDFDKKAVVKESTNYDALSPPWFLEADDAMGFYKDDSIIDKNYGEAIIEARLIKLVGPFFLEKTKLGKGRAPYYLQQSTEELVLDTNSLFDFLSKMDDLSWSAEYQNAIINSIQQIQ